LFELAVKTAVLFQSALSVVRYSVLVAAGVEVNFAELNNVHIAAALLKSFLRQLPEPLLTYELHDHIIHVQCICLCCFDTLWSVTRKTRWRTDDTLTTLASTGHTYSHSLHAASHASGCLAMPHAWLRLFTVVGILFCLLSQK